MAALSSERELSSDADRPAGDRFARFPADEVPRFSAGGPPNRQLYISLCQITDTAIALVSVVAVFVLTNLGHMPAGFQGFLALRVTLRNVLFLGLFLLFWRACFGLWRLYDWEYIATRSRELARTAAAATLGSSFMLVFVPQSSSGAFHIGVVLYSWTTATVLVLLARSALRALAFCSASAATRDVIIIGSGPRAVSLYRRLSSDPQAGYNVIGFVDSNEAAANGEVGPRLLGKLDQLESILMRQALDEVVIALPIRSCYGAIHGAIQICERVGVRAKYLADVFPASQAKPQFEDASEFSAVAMAVVPEDGRLILKRLIDLLGSLAALIVFAPVMLLAALAIRLTSPGPVLFAQERWGLNKRRFRMYKFRTMVPDAEARQPELEHLNEAAGPVFKIRHDPRVTGVGDFLRRTSIDELPQLVNVLRGEMSLVGPRPLPARDVARFTEAARMRRFSMRPGLTCLWQINGRSDLGFEDWMRLDLAYIDNWSLALDFHILVRTVPAVLGGIGAA